MNKLYLVVCVILPLSSIAQTPITAIAYTPSAFQLIHFDDRDTAGHIYMDTTQVNNLWQIGAPSKSFFNTTISSPLALMTDTLNNYPDSNLSSFYFTVYTDDYTTINFQHRMQADSLNDGGVIEVSTDGGTVWNNILSSSFSLTGFYTFGSSVSSNGGKDGFTGTYDWVFSGITGYALNFVKFRFTFSSDGNNTNKEGWMIDDIEVNCFGTGIVSFENSAGISLFPNPVTNVFSVFTNDNSVIEKIVIRDYTGKIKMITSDPRVETSHFVSGMYIAEVQTSSGKFSKRFIKQ